MYHAPQLWVRTCSWLQVYACMAHVAHVASAWVRADRAPRPEGGQPADGRDRHGQDRGLRRRARHERVRRHDRGDRHLQVRSHLRTVHCVLHADRLQQTAAKSFRMLCLCSFGGVLRTIKPLGSGLQESSSLEIIADAGLSLHPERSCPPCGLFPSVIHHLQQAPSSVKSLGIKAAAPVLQVDGAGGDRALALHGARGRVQLCHYAVGAAHGARPLRGAHSAAGAHSLALCPVVWFRMHALCWLNRSSHIACMCALVANVEAFKHAVLAAVFAAFVWQGTVAVHTMCGGDLHCVALVPIV